MNQRPAEPALEPALPIIDAHHHRRDRAGDSYLFSDLRADLNAGHNVRATIAIECGDMYRAYGPPPLRPVGETEFLAGIAAMFGSGRYGPLLACAGIVGFADLLLGAQAEGVLDALESAGGGRLRGIRNPVAWDPAPDLRKTRCGPEGVLRDPHFREGVALLGPRDLSLDAWLYHPQLPELSALAGAFPHTTFVLNHLGGPLGAGPYAGRRHEVFAHWEALLRETARHPNIMCKLGGLGLPIFGFHFDDSTSSVGYADAWRPYIETAIELFGVDRCMFVSNFPSDRDSVGYIALWNAFKRITAAYSPADRAALFSGTAMRVYRLEDTLASVSDPLASSAR
ncbi:MAG: amidohydrolase family protein [Betaproteobacteria bacterium]